MRDKISLIWTFIVLLFAMCVIFAISITNLEDRVIKLEQVCHGQCKYGDADCAARCKKAGHCDMVSDSE